MKYLGQRAFFSSSVWVVAILGVLRLAEQVEINPLDLNLPDECEDVVQGEQMDSNQGNQNSIALEQVPVDHLPWLNFSRGEFFLDGTNFGTFSRSVQLSIGTMTLSRTAYNYVYLVKGNMLFKANDTLEMRIELTGALSLKSRKLCARGCTARGPTPAWFLYFASDSNPESTPKETVMIVPERDCGILVRFRYPQARTSETSLISGEMRSLRNSGDDGLHFPPISIAGVYEEDGFKYTRMQEVRKLADSSGSQADYLQSTDVSEHSTVCESFEEGARLPVVWSSDCGLVDSSDCSPFKKYSKMYDVRSTVTSVTIQDFDCTMDGKLSGLLVFATNEVGMSTHLVLVLEGIWDFKNEHFLTLACLLDASDCGIQVSLEVSSIFRTIVRPLAIFGHVQSLRDKDDSLYFQAFSFVGGGWLSILSADSKNRLQIMNRFGRSPSLMELIEPICYQNQYSVVKGAEYPDGTDFSDMDLKILVTNPNVAPSSSETLPAFFTALEIGGSIREWSFTQAKGFPVDENQMGGQLNVSFAMYVPRMQDLFYQSKDQWFSRMTAEGLYDHTNGRLCMLACRSKIWAAEGYDDDDTDGLDCSILFNILYPQVNPSLWGELPHASGSISSLRSASDPLGFKPLKLDTYDDISMYQAKQTLWRKRVDFIISVGTLLLLILVLLPELVGRRKDQSKHQTFPCGSLVMLSALVSGHSVSLFFSIHIIMLKFSGRLSEDSSLHFSPNSVELFISVASMAALFLEARLLYLARKACVYNEIWIPKKDVSTRVSDHHIWYISLAIFGLAFTVVQLMFLSGQQLLASRYEESMYRRYHLQQMMWVNFQVSADVISYFFLLPQVLSRVLWDNKTRAPKYMYFYYLYMVLRLMRSLAQFYTFDFILGLKSGHVELLDMG